MTDMDKVLHTNVYLAGLELIKNWLQVPIIYPMMLFGILSS